MPDADPTAAPGLCTHVPPSPGQLLCQCGHHAIELEYAAKADRNAAAVAAVRTLAVRWQCEPSQIAGAVSDHHRLMCPGCNRAAQLFTALEAHP